MPYNNKDDKDLPSYVKKLSDSLRSKWVEIFNSTYESDGEKVAFIVANKWLERKLSEKRTMARTDRHIEIVKFEIDESKELIKRTDSGEDVISFKLADVFKDKFGVQLNKKVLEKWAAAINGGDTVLGDIDHEEYDRLVAKGLDEDEIKTQLKKKPSIAKAVKAVVEKGRLWVQAVIDKRYRKLIEKSKGVSMEAMIVRDANQNVVDAELFGFTFGVNDTPAIDGTEVYT